MSAIIERAKACYALEWSHRQNAFHVQTLGAVLRKNVITTARNRNPGYIVLGLFETSQEADQCIIDLRESYPDIFGSSAITVETGDDDRGSDTSDIP